MASPDNKENHAPFTSSDPLQHKSSSPAKKLAKKGRSKSIGPGDIDRSATTPALSKQEAKNRRKSTYVPATKSIISTDVEKAERQAARRRTLANRRVSFAPEATLHTWDVVEFMRDPTTSTDSSGDTRRGSSVTRASNGGSPYKRSMGVEEDEELERGEEEVQMPSSPAPRSSMGKKRRGSSLGAESDGLSDAEFSSAVASSSDASGSDEDEDEVSEDETGTAMSLDTGDGTMQSVTGSVASSTGSSARLEAALNQAAAAAGTRGIDYDEYGDMSMELAGEEVTNAFKPFAERAVQQPLATALLDQENVNPFSPAFKAQLASGVTNRPATIQEEATGDLSMDVTRAVGGIVKAHHNLRSSSPLGDGTMDFTQAVGKIQDTAQTSPNTRIGQKRRRSTTEAGSPGASLPATLPKRRRSSVARSSMGDDTMDLTVAIGGIQAANSPAAKPERRKSVARRRSSGVVSVQEEATMDFTQAVGGIKSASRAEHTGSSFDENEELTMELTTVLGGIKAAEKRVEEDVLPSTPQTEQSPVGVRGDATPKDQERFVDVPDSGPKRLLTPILEKVVLGEAEAKESSGRKRMSMSPAARTRLSGVIVQSADEAVEEPSASGTPKGSPLKDSILYPQLPAMEEQPSPARGSLKKSPAKVAATPDSELRLQLEAQLQESQPSPTVQKQQRITPIKATATLEKTMSTLDARTLANSIKLMSTPRKETLKNLTPKKQKTPAAVQASPPKMATPRLRPTPKSALKTRATPAKQFSDDLLYIQENDEPVEKIHLQAFLEQAGIRFMDLTTTKRRLTTAPTPSKTRRQSGRRSSGIPQPEEQPITLETAVYAKACTHPELEMFSHACHELKRYISDGKREIKALEASTYEDTPILIQAYQAAAGEKRGLIEAQMREMKTQARVRSKGLWYAWRGQLLDGLVEAVAGIGEGLIGDDEVLARVEGMVEGVLPGLVEQSEGLRREAEGLEEANAATSQEEREELEAARERLVEVEDEIEGKERRLRELRSEMEEQETAADDCLESKNELSAAIQEADRVREACRSVSLDEITALQGKFISHQPFHSPQS